MKIKTVYTPTNNDGAPYRVPGVYTISDIQKLGADLVAAGVTDFDTFSVSVNQEGWLQVTIEKTVDTTPPAVQAATP